MCCIALLDVAHEGGERGHRKHILFLGLELLDGAGVEVEIYALSSSELHAGWCDCWGASGRKLPVQSLDGPR